MKKMKDGLFSAKAIRTMIDYLKSSYNIRDNNNKFISRKHIRARITNKC